MTESMADIKDNMKRIRFCVSSLDNRYEATAASVSHKKIFRKIFDYFFILLFKYFYSEIIMNNS